MVFSDDEYEDGDEDSGGLDVVQGMWGSEGEGEKDRLGARDEGGLGMVMLEDVFEFFTIIASPFLIRGLNHILQYSDLVLYSI